MSAISLSLQEITKGKSNEAEEIRKLKKEIREWESAFEKRHGRKPEKDDIKAKVEMGTSIT